MAYLLDKLFCDIIAVTAKAGYIQIVSGHKCTIVIADKRGSVHRLTISIVVCDLVCCQAFAVKCYALDYTLEVLSVSRTVVKWRLARSNATRVFRIWLIPEEKVPTAVKYSKNSEADKEPESAR